MADWFYRDGSPYGKAGPADSGKGSANVYKKVTCSRCGGSKYFPYSIWEGRCFRCGATGWEIAKVKIYTAERLAKLDKVAAKKEEKRKAAWEAKEREKEEKRIKWAEQNKAVAKVLFDMIEKYPDRQVWDESYWKVNRQIWTVPRNDRFILKLYESFMNYCQLTENQVKAVEKWLEKKAEQEGLERTRKPVPDTGERMELRGVLLGTKKVTDRFSYNGGTKLKYIILEDRGFKLYGSAFGDCPEKGDRVAFRATVERSKDDEFFGFYKRPKEIEERKAA